MLDEARTARAHKPTSRASLSISTDTDDPDWRVLFEDEDALALVVQAGTFPLPPSFPSTDTSTPSTIQHYRVPQKPATSPAQSPQLAVPKTLTTPPSVTGQPLCRICLPTTRPCCEFIPPQYRNMLLQIREAIHQQPLPDGYHRSKNRQAHTHGVNRALMQPPGNTTSHGTLVPAHRYRILISDPDR
ncbi:hypothetical protein BWQ96_09772 [Gracilariopsis chorda]|uniref:Uncharacterized protein n=1 Tax=Gracilariopsis chorda TaxID=448386 RepID=A0A2V3IEK7_9FLOR|nr:hypothetical protein BWQ96_09772 [Gracilariopsis chorda]|eukprot:PXF40519.1 hypothetical protein BWQ96_09772 [Gracilariopsis chorda]